jgi:hypothetical protein
MDLILRCISDYIIDAKKIEEYPYFSLPEDCETIHHSKKKLRSYIRCMLRRNRNILEFKIINMMNADYNHIGTYQIVPKNGNIIRITIELVDAKVSFNYWHIFIN